MRLIVADDSMLIREGLAHLLTTAGHSVAEVLSSAQDIEAAVVRCQPNAVILDIRMPPSHRDEGLRAAASLRAAHADLSILVLSQYIVPEYAMRLLAQTERHTGYLLKDRVLEPDQLCTALDRLVAGETVVDPELVDMLMRSRARDPAVRRLTAREVDVLRLMAQGLSDKGISAVLFLTPNTVATHIRHIFTKLSIAAGTGDNRRVLVSRVGVAFSMW